MVSKKQLKPGKQRKTIRLTPEDERLIQELRSKTGIVSESDILRRGLRKFAEAEGVR